MNNILFKKYLKIDNFVVFLRSILLFFLNFFLKNKNIFNIKKKKNKILFLLPEHVISFYLIIFICIGIILKKTGYKIYFLRCFHHFPKCKIFSNIKERIHFKLFYCQKCLDISKKIIKFFGFNLIYFEKNNLDQIEKKIFYSTFKDLKKFTYENIEIGKHLRTIEGRGKKTDEVKRYKIDMSKIIKNCYRVLKKNSYFILVVSDSIVQKKFIDTGNILINISKKTGFILIEKFKRGMFGPHYGLHTSLKSKNIKVQNEKILNKNIIEKKEHIIILKKPY